MGTPSLAHYEKREEECEVHSLPLAATLFGIGEGGCYGQGGLEHRGVSLLVNVVLVIFPFILEQSPEDAGSHAARIVCILVHDHQDLFE